jgi:hypothetical protein
MRSAALHRLEALLHTRKLAGTLAPTSASGAMAPSGLPALDAQLGGGWPAGAISELVGPASAGRTGALVATLARAAADGSVVALVDTCDRFDPRSAADVGLDSDRLLWVRGAPITVEHARPDLLDRAVRQAVRAFDLILRAGGFAVVALDLADVPASALRRLPPATWLRLAHVVEGRPTAGLLSGGVPMGRSARGASVHAEARPIWTGSSPQSCRFEGLHTSWHLHSIRRPAGIGPASAPGEDGSSRSAGDRLGVLTGLGFRRGRAGLERCG